MTVETADVIVIGLGAMGSAALRGLAERGLRAVGIDRFHPPHEFGSSHGESRITRLAVGEGADYAPLVRRSHEIWRELEARTGETLLLECGGLVMGPRDGAARHHGKDNFVRRSIAVARANAIAHEVLEADEIARRFPQFQLSGDELGYYEPGAGVVFPERCIAAHLRLAAERGAALHLGETVLGVHSHGGGVAVRTDRRVMQAGRAVLTAGPWIGDLAGPCVARVAQVHRQTLHWFAAADPAAYAPGRFPVFIWMHGAGEEDYFYGFPALPGTATVKVASERYDTPISADAVNRAVMPAESAEMYRRHVNGRLHGVAPDCLRAAACMYTVTPDSGFILDQLPDQPNILMASACSGHGFKHSAAVGEWLAERAASSAPVLPGPFALSRYAQAG